MTHLNIPSEHMQSPKKLKNGRIFSQDDVVSYLERKGLSDDTIKRLQICTHSKTPNIAKSAKKHRNKKTKRRSTNSRSSEIKYMSNSQNILPPVNNQNNQKHKDTLTQHHIAHSPRFYQEEYKKQQRAKRMKMIKNYSDAELLKMLNQKRSRSNNKHRRRKSTSNGKRRNKKKVRRTSSVGVEARLRKRASNNNNNNNNNNNEQHKKAKNAQKKLKQLQKYYHLKLTQNNLKSATMNVSNHQKRKSKKSMHQSKSHRVIRKSQQKAVKVKAVQNISNGDHGQLLEAMEQILGKEKKNAIEEYYKNLYSSTNQNIKKVQKQSQKADNTNIKLPKIVINNEENIQIEQIEHEQNESEIMNDLQNEIDQFRSNDDELSQKENHKKEESSQNLNGYECIPASEPEIFSNFDGDKLNKFEIESYLEPDSLDNDTQIHLFLFSNAHNIQISDDLSVNPLELNLPQCENMSNFSDISHSKCIEQSQSYLPCTYYIETIEVDPNDWKKILKDERKSPKTTHGTTKCLPLFIPREQRSMYNVRDSVTFKARSRTASIQPNELQQLSAPKLHTIHELPLFKQYEVMNCPDPESSNDKELVSPRPSKEKEVVKQQKQQQSAVQPHHQRSAQPQQQRSAQPKPQQRREPQQQQQQIVDDKNGEESMTQDVIEEDVEEEKKEKQREMQRMKSEIERQKMEARRTSLQMLQDLVNDVEVFKDKENNDTVSRSQTATESMRDSELDAMAIANAQRERKRGSFRDVVKMKKMAVQIKKKAVDGMITDTIGNMEKIRSEQEKSGKKLTEDELISAVTDQIMSQMSKGIDVSSLLKDMPFLKKKKRKKKKLMKKQPQQSRPQSQPQNEEEKRENVGAKQVKQQPIATEKKISDIADIHASANKKLEPQQLIGNEPLTQGARANQTSIGSAILSVKMSGLKQRLTPSQTATASVNPYDTNQPHSKLIETEKFGHNKSTHARPPNANPVIPQVIQGNTESYKFKSVQEQQQIQQQQQQMQQQQEMMQQQMSQNAAFPPQQMMMGHPVPVPMMVQSPFISSYGGFQPHFNFSPYGQPQAQMQQGQAQQFMNQQRNERNENISDDTVSISSKRSKRSRRNSKVKLQMAQKRPLTSPNNAQIKDLFTKAINNRYNEVEELFAGEMDPNSTDEHGNGILHVAAQNGNKRMIKVALRWGANINAQNKQGQTALHYLFAYKYENLAAYLISKGSDDTIQNEFGYTCYDGLRPSADAQT